MTVKFLIGWLIVAAAQISLAQVQDSTNELEVGAQAQDRQSYLSQVDRSIIDHVNNEIREKCDSHGCTFVARVDHKKGWTVTFNLGNGPVAYGSGTVINVGGGSSTVAGSDTYYGLTLSYTNLKCTSDFKLDLDDFINNKARAIAEREDGTYNMKPLTSDMKFIQLLKLEIYKQLGQSGCLR
jgi:hypothetical protein